MKKLICWLGLLATLTIIFSGCGSVNITLPTTTPTAGNNTTGAGPHWGVQTKTSGCVAQGGLPDPACTPGALLATGTKDAICQSHHSPGQYEVDHLVSLELGGSNDISNLWPELASPKPGFHEKDKVENYLHSQVCSGAISLKEAQIEIATNWLGVYNRMPH